MITRAALIFAAFAFSITSLSSNIERYNTGFLEKKGYGGVDKDILNRVFGELRTYLSSASYINADIYFHGGMYDFHESCPLTTPGHISSHDEKEDDGHDIHGQTQHPRKDALNPLLAISEQVSITRHRHLAGEEEKELLPWILYSVKLDPNNEKAYVIGGYWLGRKLNKTGEAVSFLLDGIKNNPESWNICLMLGEIYMINLKDYQSALVYLEKARDLAENKKADKFDIRPVYTFLAEAYAETGSPEEAANLYEKLLKLFPDDEIIKKRALFFKNEIIR